MKPVHHLLTAGFFIAAVTVTLPAAAATDDLDLPKAPHEMTLVDWHSFSATLVDALKSDNDALVQSAMRLTIQYDTKVDVRRAIPALMSVYRDHNNEAMRRLAVVTLGHTGSRFATEYLRLNLEFEKSPAVKNTIRGILVEA